MEWEVKCAYGDLQKKGIAGDDRMLTWGLSRWGIKYIKVTSAAKPIETIRDGKLNYKR